MQNLEDFSSYVFFNLKFCSLAPCFAIGIKNYVRQMILSPLRHRHSSLIEQIVIQSREKLA